MYNLVENANGSKELQPVTKNLATTTNTNDYIHTGPSILLEGQQLTDFNGLTLTPIIGSHVVNSAPVIDSSNTGTVVENADISTVIYTATY